MFKRTVTLSIVLTLIFPVVAGAAWSANDVKTIHVYDAHAKIQASDGITASTADGHLVLTLNGKVPYADVLLPERVPFDPREYLHVDLTSITGGDSTVQIVALDSAGQILDSIPIFQGITEADSYEMPLAAYRSAFPPQTKDIAVRLWLGGQSGARAEFAQIALGVNENSPIPPAPKIPSHQFAPAREGAWNIPGQPPFVLAHYVDWFSMDTPIGGETWSHWSRSGAHGHDASKRREDGLRDIASVLYPLIGTYATNDPTVVRYHLATMKAAGIDGLIVDWYGQGHNSDICLPVIFAEAEKLDMKVALCVEEKMFCVWKMPKTRAQMVDNMTEALTYAYKTWVPRKAYLRRNNLPFMIQFNSWGTGKLGPLHLTPDEWITVFSRLPGQIEYCRQNLDPAYHPIIPAAYTWWSEGNRPLEFADQAVALRDKGRLEFFMSMLCVGFNDTGVWGWGDGPRVSKTYGMSVLKHSEEMATVHDPELIQCVTWNDFNESTCFEPTTKYGFQWVDEVEKYIGQLHKRPVNLEDNREPYRGYLRAADQAHRAEIPKVSDDLLKP
jgi:glycoprotein endo-alpha-1,2-mannosidase